MFLKRAEDTVDPRTALACDCQSFACDLAQMQMVGHCSKLGRVL